MALRSTYCFKLSRNMLSNRVDRIGCTLSGRYDVTFMKCLRGFGIILLSKPFIDAGYEPSRKMVLNVNKIIRIAEVGKYLSQTRRFYHILEVAFVFRLLATILKVERRCTLTPIIKRLISAPVAFRAEDILEIITKSFKVFLTAIQIADQWGHSLSRQKKSENSSGGMEQDTQGMLISVLRLCCRLYWI